MYLYNIKVRSETASADIKAAGSYPENSTKVINIGGYSNNRASQVVLMVKNPPANTGDARDAVSTPGLGRSPREGNGNPLQYSCLENPIDRGA